MRKSSLEITFEKFFDQISFYRDLLTKIKHTDKISYDNPEVIKSLKTTGIDLREKKEVFEALFLKIYVTWEILVEELLIDCLNRDISQYATHKETTFPKHLPRSVCKALITGLRYFDVRSVGEIQKISRQILIDRYNPFKSIDEPSKKRINETYIIRRYLAHYSDQAKRELRRLYKDKYNLKHFRQPGDFLFAFDKETKQIRLANYINAFINAADAMAKFLSV